MIYGFLRETAEQAKKSGLDPDTGLPRTGLEQYLAIIFPKTQDFVHDKIVPGSNSRKRPDYRSESLKLIIEFDGSPHYTDPIVIQNDEQSTKFYQDLGYKVVRIPYFIQLSNSVVKELFGVEVKEQLFDEIYPSLSIKNKNTPAFLCDAGIKRMKKEFKRFPKQYEININYLKSLNNEFLTGIELLKE